MTDRRSELDHDHIVQWMRSNGMEVNLDNYLAIAFPDGLPDPMPVEYWLEIPAALRDGMSADEYRSAARKSDALPTYGDLDLAIGYDPDNLPEDILALRHELEGDDGPAR